MSSERFYHELESFNDFNGIVSDGNFHEIPEDWYVVITDVKGSTKAIEAGRYKDVNTVGAATIVSAHKAIGDLDFPFVFGGDGATLVIPPTKVEAVRSELLGLKKVSEEYFELGLRVGFVEMKEIMSEGGVGQVAKYELIAGKCIAIFRGGALSMAEDKVKGDPDNYELNDVVDYYADLSGLSCRWNPIPTKNGKILSLLVLARQDDPRPVYQNIMEEFDRIFEGRLDEANPVNVPQMSYKSIGQCYQDEKRYQKSIFSLGFVLRFMEIVFAVLVFKFKVPPLFFNPKKYASAMKTHSDFRKFDDMLRMIIDCTDVQIEKIQSYFNDLHQSGEVFYGLHETDNALMTCFVGDLEDGNHIHFIDGGDGGYAMAAKQLKAQMKGEEDTSVSKRLHPQVDLK